MDDNYHDIEMRIGGKFVEKSSRLVYGGGKNNMFENVDLDRFNLDDISEMYAKCGGKCAIVDFYFKRPGATPEIGLRTINRHLPDMSVGEMTAAYTGPLNAINNEQSDEINVQKKTVKTNGQDPDIGDQLEETNV
ncbi:hypothetical protein BUALT_Bualt12G0100300 [Buddleja alternifolia]|uniref:PB1-like domain-containing protein n=1 Tax=Buddleja alternifolia TaxID=168488 RepID=A0AAV6X0H8_9LAMI|nr:hypothetical protein BUALT_Bualt12G0100300 [Buddleja alternifolia]